MNLLLSILLEIVKWKSEASEYPILQGRTTLPKMIMFILNTKHSHEKLIA